MQLWWWIFRYVVVTGYQLTNRGIPAIIKNANILAKKKKIIISEPRWEVNPGRFLIRFTLTGILVLSVLGLLQAGGSVSFLPQVLFLVI